MQCYKLFRQEFISQNKVWSRLHNVQGRQSGLKIVSAERGIAGNFRVFRSGFGPWTLTGRGRKTTSAMALVALASLAPLIMYIISTNFDFVYFLTLQWLFVQIVANWWFRSWKILFTFAICRRYVYRELHQHYWSRL